MSVVEMLLLMNAENVMEIMPPVQAVQILMQITLIQMQLFHVMIAVNILIMMDWLLSMKLTIIEDLVLIKLMQTTSV